MQLENRVHFVCPADKVWPPLRGGTVDPIPDDELSRICIGPTDCWVLRPYYELARRGAEVTLSPHADPDAINVTDVYELGVRSRDSRSFMVVTRGDGPFPQLGNFVILQNACYAARPNTVTFPLFPQAGIKPRDPGRGDTFAVVAFKGAIVNLAEEFRTPDFQERLSELGLTYEAMPDWSEIGGFWSDYSATDVVVSIRRASAYDLKNKPASKLINAWFGEVPAILGPEVGYRELRQSDLDYIEVETPDELIDTLTRLRDDPGLREAMVENGRERRKDFTSDAIVARWRDALNGPSADAFRAWSARSRVDKLASTLWMKAQDIVTRRRHYRRVFHDPRVVNPFLAGGSG